MQFTLKKVVDSEEGKEIVGINYEGKEVRYPFNDSINEDVLLKLENKQIIFEGGRILGAWSEKGQVIYAAKDHHLGHDTVR